MFLVNCTRVLRTFQHSFNLILDLLAYTIGSLNVMFSCNLTPSDNLHQIWTQKKIRWVRSQRNLESDWPIVIIESLRTSSAKFKLAFY